MKLRCTKDSIRIRVRKSELALLTEHKAVHETIRIAETIVFKFSLVKKVVDLVTATLAENELTVILPESLADSWISSNQVGIEVTNQIGESGQLHILVEKDFPCLDREEEDYEDTFHELADMKEKDAC